MKSNSNAEINRIKEAYKQRDSNISSSTWGNDIYHPRHPIDRLFYEHNHNILVDALNCPDIDLENSIVLDVGCGGGARENEHLRAALRWSLVLRSFFPLKFAKTVTSIFKRINSALKFSRGSSNSINVMHLFGTYLPMTENWCYRLIKNLPDTHLYIVAEKSDNEGLFTLSNSLYLIMPTAEWPMAPHPAIKTGTKLLCIFLRKLWMRFLIYFAGRSSILHAHFSYMGWNYLWLAEMKKVPLVVSYYGCDYEYLPNHEPVWKERYRDMFRRVALFIAEGNAGRNKLIAMGCPEDKVKVVHLGVETSIIPFYRRNKNPGELKLVQVATFISKKGYDTTVNAFIQAVKKCPGLTLTLVGKDPEGMRGTLHQTIREHDLEGQVEFIDGIDFAKLHLFLKRFHVFIHPSRYGNKGDSEGGAPVVLLDAQATGLPVLSTTHCDIPEEVVDGVTGILVEENDVDGLARAIEIFYRMDEAEYHVFCEQARRHIERHYDAVTSGKQLRDAYKDVLTNCRGDR